MTTPRVPEIDRVVDFVRRGSAAQTSVDREISRAPIAEDGNLPWVVWAPEHRAWWKPNRLGYAEAIDDAGVYSLAEALEIWIGSRYNDVPVPRSAAVLLMAALDRRAKGLDR